MPDPSDSRRSATRGSGKSNWLRLDLVEDDGGWSGLVPAHDLIAAAGRGLAAHPRFEGSGPSTACIALSDDATVRALNARYRGKDRATNVLSFPAPVPLARDSQTARNLGDVALARETVVEEARAQGIPLGHHLQHLVIHGLLHLLGCDHEDDAGARDMEGLEIEILAGLGIANPYADPADGAEVASAPAGALLRHR